MRASVIAHFDIDAFYASVAQRDDPSLRGKPLAVAWDSRRSVVLTASYEARPFGVRSAMALYRAKELCPELVVVQPNFERYREASRAVFEIIGRGALATEGLSLDEAFVAYETRDFAEAVARATQARASVRAEVGLTISAGVSAQKMLAKIASDDAKPDGLRAVEPGTEAAYLAPLPVGRLWGIGPKTQVRMKHEGIETIGDIAVLGDDDAFRLFGRGGKALRELARGNDTRTVSEDRETRSVSCERTFEFDLKNEDDVRAAVREAAADVAQRLLAHGLRGSTVGIKLKRSNFTTLVRQTSLATPTNDFETIARAADYCVGRAELGGAAVRLAGVRVASLTEKAVEQISLFGGDPGAVLPARE